jgi:hypothetical protein
MLLYLAGIKNYIMIKTQNDHKEKHQSWTATIDEIDGSDSTGYYNNRQNKM